MTARDGARDRLDVPFFRPSITRSEIDEVVDTLESGWLTTGPKTRMFEQEFARAVGAEHAVALNSCTAALHLAVDALGLGPGDAVLVPTMTFAATAEVVRYRGAVPVLVDCDPVTLNMDLEDADRKLALLTAGGLRCAGVAGARAVGMIPVHVGGLMMDPEEVDAFARERRLWVVEDAAHAFPAAARSRASGAWRRCGAGTARVTCFSFYANKTITTGEGGMATTADPEAAERIRLMSLHGLSKDAWGRYGKGGSWDYSIVAPGYKYNLTDVASSIGLHQLRRAEEMRRAREAIAARYLEAFAGLEETELPPTDPDRVHSWHLFPLRLRLDRLSAGRDALVEELAARGIGCSVHWRPLHLHPYYRDAGWRADDCPTASAVWERLVSLPIFPAMRPEEVEAVIDAVLRLCGARVLPRAARGASRDGFRRTDGA